MAYSDEKSPPSSSRPRWHGGRPRLKPAERRSADLSHVRVTPAEFEQVRAQAAELGLSVAELIRRAVLGIQLRRAVPAINREAWGRLGPLAANLNQYVRAINQGQATGAPRSLLEDLRREVAALREALLGRDPEAQ
jgi:hypothetical protein